MKDKIEKLIDLYNRRLVELSREKYYNEAESFRTCGKYGCLEDVIIDLREILEEEK